MTSSIRRIKRCRPLLGTWVEIELSGPASEALLQRCITRGFKAIETVDRLMSVYKPQSELNRLNRAPAGRWLTLHPLTISVLTAVLELYDQSDGIFDTRTRLGFQTRPLQIEGHRVRKTGPWTFDLGGIAKGFAVDHAFESIRRAAPRHRLIGSINAGGDLRLWGKKQMPAALRILTSKSSTVKSIMTAPGAMATSTLRHESRTGFASVKYRRLPKKSAHRLNRTATVFADECLWADALTKIVLMGPSDTAKKCLALHDARAVVHSANGEITEVFS